MTNKEFIAKLVEKEGGGALDKLKDPVFFINNVIGFDLPPYKLTSYQEEWLRLLEKHDRLCFMAFRSSGKTESMLVDYPIFKAFTQTGWQGIIVSNSLKQSVSVLRRIREKILGNELLRSSVPSGRGGLWSKTELQLKNGSMIWSRPANENIVGEHVDFIGGDEIGYWREMDLINKQIPPMVRAKNGKLVFIGTPTSRVDPLHKLEKNEAYITKRYPANGRDPETNKTLWSLRYPDIPMSQAKLEYDDMSWSREFLLKPLSTKDKIYPYELIKKSFDFDASFTLHRNEHSAYYMGLDFALSGEAGSDYTVFSVLEKKGDVCRLVNMERYKGLSYQSQKSRIQQLSDIFRPVKVVADKGSFGQAFIQDLRSMSIPVEEFKFTNQSKQDLHTNMRNMFEQDLIIINKSDDDLKTKSVTDYLVSELNNFGIIYDENTSTVKFEGLGAHDDAVTSLALACWGARGSGKINWNISRGSSSKGQRFFCLGKVN